jgi:hypothetical protein
MHRGNGDARPEKERAAQLHFDARQRALARFRAVTAELGGPRMLPDDEKAEQPAGNGDKGESKAKAEDEEPS